MFPAVKPHLDKFARGPGRLERCAIASITSGFRPSLKFGTHSTIFVIGSDHHSSTTPFFTTFST